MLASTSVIQCKEKNTKQEAVSQGDEQFFADLSRLFSHLPVFVKNSPNPDEFRTFWREAYEF